MGAVGLVNIEIMFCFFGIVAKCLIQRVTGRDLMTRPAKCLISDFEAFADAAEEFHPHMKFYATFNPKVCNHDLLYQHEIKPEYKS